MVRAIVKRAVRVRGIAAKIMLGISISLFASLLAFGAGAGIGYYF